MLYIDVNIILYGYRNTGYRVLIGEVRERLKEILRELCEWQEITILEGAIKEDHVHMYLSVPPKHSPSDVMKILKGKSAEYLAREFPELAKRYWGMHIWRRQKGRF
jgi:putative transposase